MLTVVKTEDFSTDVRQQIRWYLYHAALDDVLAAEVVDRFTSAIEDTLEFLARTPGAGRRRAARFCRPARLPRLQCI